MTTIRFTCIDKPEPAGSKKAFAFARRDGSLGANVVDDNDKSKSWKRSVAVEARLAYDGPLLTGALAVTFVFYRPRPKGHFGAKGLKPSAPKYPTTKPDVLKCARAVEDALSKVIYQDDAQIVIERIYKQYGEPARCECVIEEL